MMAELRGMKDMSYTHNLIKKFELDPFGKFEKNGPWNETKTCDCYGIYA